MKLVGTPKEISAELWNLPQDKKYELREFRPARTTKENAYFHRLVGLLAKGEHAPESEIKNEMVRAFGNHELVRDKDGKPVYKILPDDGKWKRDEVYHYYPTEYTDTFRGIEVRAFVILTGTRTYNTAEMAYLIACTRDECLGCGIPLEEVETPEEAALFGRRK